MSGQPPSNPRVPRLYQSRDSHLFRQQSVSQMRSSRGIGESRIEKNTRIRKALLPNHGSHLFRCHFKPNTR